MTAAVLLPVAQTASATSARTATMRAAAAARAAEEVHATSRALELLPTASAAKPSAATTA